MIIFLIITVIVLTGLITGFIAISNDPTENLLASAGRTAANWLD